MFHDHNGKLSSMRIGFLTCLTLGGLLILSGIAGIFMQVPESTVMVNVGGMLCGSSGFAKSIQKKFENDNAS